MANEWFYNHYGKTYGPVTLENLHHLVRTGFITRQTPVWTEDWAEWMPATAVPGLFPAVEPPPLAPAPTNQPAPARPVGGIHWVSSTGMYGVAFGIYNALFVNAARGAALMVLGIIFIVVGILINEAASKKSN